MNKATIHQACITAILQRIQNAEEAITMARESANEEGKSSAGDKHETGRAMAQLEQEKAGKQLAELREQMDILNRIDPEKELNRVTVGSLVETTQGVFYISVAVGKIEGTTAFAISAASPLGLKLTGLTANDGYELNGKSYAIRSVC